MSGPEAFRGLYLCRSFLTPSSVTGISLVSGNGSPSGSGMAVFGFSCVKVEWYCLLRISALSLELLNKRPLSFNGAIPVKSFRRDLM